MQKERVRPYFLLALLVAALILVIFVFRPFIGVLVLAVVFSVILYPLYRTILRAVKWPGLAAAITMFIGAICVVIPLVLIGVQVVNEAQNLYAALSGVRGPFYIDKIINVVEHTMARFIPQFEGISGELSSDISSYLRQGLSWLIERWGTIFSSIAALMLKTFLFFVSLYYFLREGSKIKKTVIEISPLNDSDDEAVFTRLEIAINSVIKGNLTIAVIQGIVATGGFLLFGVPNAVLWGTVAAVSALIPWIGTSIVIIPAIAYLLIVGNPVMALGLFIWGVLAVGLVDNIVGPKLIGRHVKIHSLIILLAVLGGMVLFGPIGLFLGPLSASLLFALLEIYSKSAEIQNQ